MKTGLKAFEGIKSISIDDRDASLSTSTFGVYVDAVTDDGTVTLCRCESRIAAEAIRRAIYYAKGWDKVAEATVSSDGNVAPPIMRTEMIAMGDIHACSDRGCELDASVFITVDQGEKKAWCTGHAHCEISVWMVGL